MTLVPEPHVPTSAEEQAPATEAPASPSAERRGNRRSVKLRVRFSKTGKVRFTSHRDVARIWERGLRRAGLPVSYTEGFSPRPKLSFGLALPTGCESHGEYLDVDLRDDVEPEQMPALLNPALPAGMEVQAAAALPAGAGSLQQLVTSCTWRIELVGIESPDAFAAVERVLAADELTLARERKGRMVTDDVRPAIVALVVIGPTQRGTELEAELATVGRTLRPSELVEVLIPGTSASARMTRTHQWTQDDGARRELVSLAAGVGATSPPHAEVRAR
jgi:radical SAM-linked protein